MWETIIVPVPGGVVVYVTDGKTRSLIGRVAWSRWNATGHFKLGTFKHSLRKVLSRAEVELMGLNRRE